jgi:hypothetical protein
LISNYVLEANKTLFTQILALKQETQALEQKAPITQQCMLPFKQESAYYKAYPAGLVQGQQIK